MSWQGTLDELEKRKSLARRMGGPDKIQRQHDHGKLTVRERINRLLDANSFREIGSICGSGRYDETGNLLDFTPANQVIGRGTIDGRPVVVYGDDFTVRGGAADAANKEKLLYPENMAYGLRIPLIRLVDGTGGGGSIKNMEKAGYSNVPGGGHNAWGAAVRNLSAVPVVSMAMGSVAGKGAGRVCVAHYSLMIKNTSQIFVGGPPLVARLGQKVTKEELGGSDIHGRNGTVDDAVATEDEAFERARRFLSYLPRSVHELPPRGEIKDDPLRREEKLLSIIPKETRRVYQMRTIIEAVVDAGSFFEIGKQWGKSIISGFARLDGWPIALIAEDPYNYAGTWTRSSCEKLTRFVDLAQTFHLPVVHLVDCPGFPIGVQAEKEATIRGAVRAMSAINSATIPWCSILIRNVFGIAGGAHRPIGSFSSVYAWPSVRTGSLPFEGGVEVAYKAEIEASDNPGKRLDEINQRLESIKSPFRTAERFAIEEMIDPRDTRMYLCEFANIVQGCLETGAPRSLYRP